MTETWTSITEDELLDKVNFAWARMTPSQRSFWTAIRLKPEQWRQSPCGDLGAGFWIVAVMGQQIVWYNDVEEGFNRSNYTTSGEFTDYRCELYELEHVIQHLIAMVQND